MKHYDLEELKKMFRLTPEGLLQRYYDPKYGQEKQGWVTVDNVVGKAGYMRVNGAGHRSLKVHNVVWMLSNNANIPDGLMVDHIDRVKTNNLPSNLRIVTSRENRMNSEPVLKNDGRCTFFDKRCKGWRSGFYKNGEDIKFGPFENEEGAAAARQIAVASESEFIDGDAYKSLVESRAADLGFEVVYRFKNKGYEPLLDSYSGKYRVFSFLNKKMVYFGMVKDYNTAKMICDKICELRKTNGDPVALCWAMAQQKRYGMKKFTHKSKIDPNRVIIYSN
jgi:hypothetical protein